MTFILMNVLFRVYIVQQVKMKSNIHLYCREQLLSFKSEQQQEDDEVISVETHLHSLWWKATKYSFAVLF